MLVALQLVLGFDNLLYISIESKRAPLDRQSFVRKFGIGLAVILRIGLLFVLVNLIKWANVEMFSIDLNNYIQGHFPGSLILLLENILSSSYVDHRIDCFAADANLVVKVRSG